MFLLSIDFQSGSLEAVAFKRAAEMMANLGFIHESAVFWCKAGDMMSRVISCFPSTVASRLLRPSSAAHPSAVQVDSIEGAALCETAAVHYCELGRFFTAANIVARSAEALDEERKFGRAMERYRRASDLYIGVHATAQSCRCLHRVASLLGLLERFVDAALEFQKLAEVASADNMMRTLCPDLFFRAGLCLLADQGPIREGLYSHKV